MLGITSDVQWALYHVKSLKSRLEMLPERPNFLTEGRAVLDDAIQYTELVLVELRKARDAYDAKPLERSNA